MSLFNEKRNYGIDLLRIVSMFMVVVLHVLGSGGLLNSVYNNPLYDKVLWLIEIACYCAVNCYAIISGYVGYKSKFKFTNVIVLWLQVFFYTFLINGIFWVFGLQSFSFDSLKSAFLPVMNRDYWYFTAYFVMYMFIPILNTVLKRFNKKQMGIILGLGFVLFSLIPTILMNDPFHLMKGYSAVWLGYLYLLGGYINKHGLFSKGKALEYIIYYICVVLFTFLSKLGIELLSMKVFGEVKYNMMFIEYTSPTILLCGIFLVVAFSKMKVNKLSKVISFLAPLSFSVYLIHNNPVILNSYWTDAFRFISNYNLGSVLLLVIGCSLGVYISCSCIDLIRHYLFRFLKVKEKVLKLENKYLKDLFRV